MKTNILFFLVIALISVVSAKSFATSAMEGFQQDADKARLEHLVYWTGLFEEYKTKAGFYPLQNILKGKQTGLVRIATREQREYFNPKSAKYNAKLDNNADRYFQEFPVKLLVDEIEHRLGRNIEEKYDIQKAPFGTTPNHYAYFPTREGYLMWVVCQTCGVTKITTLLMDGSTLTVNIVSEGMEGKVTKALTRQVMMDHPLFKEWIARPYQKEGFVQVREAETAHDSEK